MSRKRKQEKLLFFNCFKLSYMYSRLAESRGYQKLHDLKEDYMKHLLQSEQYEKAGQLLEKDGKHEQAIEMYLKSSRLMKIPRLILNHNNLLSDGNLINSVIKKLLKHEHFEGVAEIYEKLEKTDLAMQCYRKGNILSNNYHKFNCCYELHYLPSNQKQ